MGYTNYIRQKRDFTDDEWRQITDEYNYILEFKRISPLDCPDDVIMFNGKNQSCETFMLCKNINDYFTSDQRSEAIQKGNDAIRNTDEIEAALVQATKEEK